MNIVIEYMYFIYCISVYIRSLFELEESFREVFFRLETQTKEEKLIIIVLTWVHAYYRVWRMASTLEDKLYG